MFQKTVHFFTILPLIILWGCAEKKENNPKQTTALPKVEQKDTIEASDNKKDTVVKEDFFLTEENAISFFFDYAKKYKENKVKITTKYGSFIVDLFEETPYHRANFIYLTKKGYFNDTYFHRVVKNFIIQGGNSDNVETAKKRGEIGRYLLPPDTKKGFKHHRGTISMPSSDDVNNPHKLASPYEFFIVVTNPGSYHLDGKYTAFGRVIEGMDVVDKINALPTDEGEWPLENIAMKVEIVE